VVIVINLPNFIQGGDTSKEEKLDEKKVLDSLGTRARR
jgi:hypothetical protein